MHFGMLRMRTHLKVKPQLVDGDRSYEAGLASIALRVGVLISALAVLAGCGGSNQLNTKPHTQPEKAESPTSGGCMSARQRPA